MLLTKTLVWRADPWMEWPRKVRFFIALAAAVILGGFLPQLLLNQNEEALPAVAFAMGCFVLGTLCAFISPLVPFALWFATLFHHHLEFANWPLRPGQLAGMAFLWSGIAAALSGRLSLGGLHQGSMAVLLILALMLASRAWWSIHPATGRALTPYPLLYATIALILAASLKNLAAWRFLAWSLVIITALSALPGWAQASERGTFAAAMAGRFEFALRVRGTAANPIVFGWNMIYALPPAIALLFLERCWFPRFLAAALGTFCLLSSLFSLNRQGFVLTAVAVGGTLFFSPIRYRGMLALVFGLAAGGLGLMMMPAMVERIVAALEADPTAASGGLFRDPSFLERRDAFITGMEALKAHPWLGIGLGAFAFSWRDFYPRDGSTYFTQTTLEVERRFLDNGYIQVLVETGIIGFLVSALVMVWLSGKVFSLWYRFSRHPQTQSETALGAWVLGLGAFVAVGTLVQDTIMNPRVWILFALTLALGKLQNGIASPLRSCLTGPPTSPPKACL